MSDLGLEAEEARQNVLKPSFVSIIKVGFRLFIHSGKVFLPLLIKLIVFFTAVNILHDFLLRLSIHSPSVSSTFSVIIAFSNVFCLILYFLLMILYYPIVQRYMITGEKLRIKFIFPIIGRREIKYFLCIFYFILITVVMIVITVFPVYLIFGFFPVLPELFEVIIYYAIALIITLFINLRILLGPIYVLDNAVISVHQAIKASYKVTKGSIILLFFVLVLVGILETLINLTLPGTQLFSTFSMDTMLYEFNITNKSIIEHRYTLRWNIIIIFIIIQYYLKTLVACSFCSSIYLHYRQKLTEITQEAPVSSS